MTNPGGVFSPSTGEWYRAFKETLKTFPLCGCYLLFCLGVREKDGESEEQQEL